MYDFTKLYREAKPKVYRYIFFLCGDKAVAEELTQETFYQAYLSLKTFQGNSKATTWVIGIARNIYLNQYHRDKNLSLEEIDLNKLSTLNVNEPDKALIAKEDKTEIITILQAMPEWYRSVIIWREIEGLTFEEIGRLLHKSPATVRVLLFRAKKRFRELYIQKYG